MQLTKLSIGLASAWLFTFAACGPEQPVDEPSETWMVGSFNVVGAANKGREAIDNLHIFEDKTARVEHLTDCGLNVTHEEGRWTYDGPDTIVIRGAHGGEFWGVDHVRVTKLECNQVQVEEIRTDGSLRYSYLYHRGRMCLTPNTESCESECDCMTTWCDGPPESCD